MGKGWIDEALYSKIKETMPIPCVDLLVVYDGKLLLTRRTNSPAKGLWFTPGGRIRRGESIEDAVRRLLFEETGLSPLRITRMGVMSHMWPAKHCVTVYHRVDVDSTRVRLNGEHDHYKWIDGVEDGLHPYIVHMITSSGLF